MVDEERRRQFGVELMASHRRYQEERDRQYDIYMWTCRRSREERDREMKRVGPLDRAGTVLAFEHHDRQTEQARHIFNQNERSAWARHQAEAAELRSKYGVIV